VITLPTALTGSMPDWLRQRARSSPSGLALTTATERLTFAELDAAVDSAASRLVALGIRPGDTVAILAGNSGGFVRTVHAVARLGAILLPLNIRLTPSELEWQVRDAGARMVVADAERRSAADALGIQVAALERVTGPGTPAGKTPPERAFDLAAAMAIVYTSGTTGQPKGAVLTYGNQLWSAVGSALNLGVFPTDRWLACLPLFHVGGLAILLRSVIYGMTAVVHDGFDPARVNQAIDKDEVSIISVVANMLQRMLEHRGARPYPASLRCVLLGGGPAPQPLLELCAAGSVPVVQTYGLTEAASQVTTLAPADALRKLGSAGKPLFGTEVRIESDEILVRGPTVTPGYLNRPTDTSRTLRGGWLHTGDLGRLDDEGYLYVLDRRDDLIVSGGENVYPAEIEATLQSHFAVQEAGVFGQPDERWGQVAVAVVVVRPNSIASTEQLLEYCRERLARYKVPQHLIFETSLPRNAAGKLLRSELRSKYGS
jgi:O-succinylbenzoic acid--CoA ligase